jgi:NitT/TauT family transport system ATP-binding protein
MSATIKSDLAPPAAAGAPPRVHARLRAVTRSFTREADKQTLHALGPVDLDLMQGEFFSIIGPSGCGKSSFLKVLAGLDAPTSGTISFEGEPVNGVVPEGVGVVFQEDASFPWLNVSDNVAFGLRWSGLPKAAIRARVESALAFIGLSDFAASYPAQLSGGMRQRVCIARTLVTRPRLILLDEPFGALDQQTRLLMGEELLRLWRETGATVLLITHSLDEAVMLSQRIGVMSARPGRFIEILETGWPDDRDSAIVEDPRFGALTSRLWSFLRRESLKTMKGAPKGATAKNGAPSP